MKLGMVGLGRMGGNMSKRLEQDGHEVGALRPPSGGGTASSLEELVGQLEAPRVVWLMIPAGDPTEQTFDGAARPPRRGRRDRGRRQLELPRLAAPRTASPPSSGIRFLDAGVSGGIWGLEVGYCLMVGGDDEAVDDRPRPPSRRSRRANGWAHVGAVRRGPLREDGPQRDRVRPHAGLRRGLRAHAPLRVRPRPRRDRRDLALRLGRPLVAPRAPLRGVRAGGRRRSRTSRATSRTRARAAGRSTRRST